MDLELTDNAAWQQAGAGPALPAAIPGVAWAGNVDCGADPSACWLDPAARDFWPADASPLLSGGAAPTLAPPLTDDFCGQPRGVVPHAGALERTLSPGPGPLPVAFKSEFACPEPAGGTTGGDTTGGDTSTTGDATTAATSAPTTGSAASTSGAATGAPSDTDTDGATTVADDFPTGGCGCRSGHAPSALSLIALLALTRRRRRAAAR